MALTIKTKYTPIPCGTARSSRKTGHGLWPNGQLWLNLCRFNQWLDFGPRVVSRKNDGFSYNAVDCDIQSLDEKSFVTLKIEVTKGNSEFITALGAALIAAANNANS